MMRYTDMIGETIQLQNAPQRIISLVPSQTELLYDLGLSEEVVGITKFCVHPDEWFRQKVRVGGTKNVSIERIAALAPDLIIANKEENTQSDIEALRLLAPVWTSDIRSFSDCLQLIQSLGTICQRIELANLIVQNITADFAQLPFKHLNGRSVAYFIWNEPFMVAAQDTFVHHILEQLGLKNVFSSLKRYPEIGWSDLIEANPDFVLLSSEPYPFKEKHLNQFKEMLPQADVLLVDGELFSWYGSRLLHSLSYFKSLFGNNMS